MFKRLTYLPWTDIVPILAFILTAAVFAVFFWRALRMRREEADALSRLPLENDGPKRGGDLS